jgi:hypothetical protein
MAVTAEIRMTDFTGAQIFFLGGIAVSPFTLAQNDAKKIVRAACYAERDHSYATRICIGSKQNPGTLQAV